MIFTAKRILKTSSLYPLAVAALEQKYGKGKATELIHSNRGGATANWTIKGKRHYGAHVTGTEINAIRIGATVSPFDPLKCGQPNCFHEAHRLAIQAACSHEWVRMGSLFGDEPDDWQQCRCGKTQPLQQLAPAETTAAEETPPTIMDS